MLYFIGFLIFGGLSWAAIQYDQEIYDMFEEHTISYGFALCQGISLIGFIYQLLVMGKDASILWTLIFLLASIIFSILGVIKAHLNVERLFGSCDATKISYEKNRVFFMQLFGGICVVFIFIILIMIKAFIDDAINKKE